mgnify:FL=1
MFKLSSIKVGMKYQNIRNEIIKSNNLVMSCLPAFCNSNYDVAENLDTKEKVYVLRDYDTGIITDVTTDYYKAVNAETAQRNISEILYNNGYWLEKILWYKLINDLLNLTGDEIYQKYGYKRDETITHTAKFPNGIEADIKLVICEEEAPYTEGVLFHNGFELTCTEPDCTYDGEWNFEHNGIEYTVLVEIENWWD